MEKYDVFISCKSEDYKYAEEIYYFLRANGINVFIASKELRIAGESEYIKAISNALEEAYHIIVVASNPSYINSGWVEYEWNLFLCAKLKGKKPGNIITILKDMSTDDLPINLGIYESFSYNDYKQDLLQYVRIPNDIVAESSHIKESPKQQNSKENYLYIQIGEFTLRMIRVESGRVGCSDKPYYDFIHSTPLTDVPSFYISEFPVTQDLYDLVMRQANTWQAENIVDIRKKYVNGGKKLAKNIAVGAAAALIGGPIVGLASVAGMTYYGITNKQKSNKNQNPAVMVNLLDAEQFCMRLSHITNRQFSLPNDHEWEYAARGGQKSKRYIYAGGDDINEVGWYLGNSDGSIHPVGEKKPNELGIYDMCGNVCEWTCTKCQSTTNDYKYICKGGSYMDEASICTISKKFIANRDKRSNGLGFRVILR